ncbi:MULTISPECIES: hypothetical protein [Tenacibaculum]|uniref:Type VI secretion system, VipA, VC_A0107 or Hcp2 n=2 Tax=Tenacibaculum TaxID=104267 RepID=A0AAE9SG68_9FLAO|nr:MULTISPECIES: hypothetical protein [Tenacibaculum]GFD76220.1 hypothetical protein KUL113_56400 [Tenacibaculum sp. KUL113]GFD82260.1 hypothetical protein KUL118_51220 [Tenacibaculum sp. KUL118]GFD97038.1 hypothetical protein KUL154_57710 [Alteromonas sp. KUL154]GFE01866.1 hypothetical protein KUL156_44580 [Alteromonas sp. KUL156]AZJ32572.1 hypothetical protein D6200_08410 [Tenacibaculum mesophilum]
MAMYNYGIGGNEVKVDANESIANISSNKTLLIQKLTDEAPATPEAIYGLDTIEAVFEKFSPSVNLEHTDENGADVKESLNFNNLGDFNVENIKANSSFLNKLDIEKDQYLRISRQLSSNRALMKALSNPETKDTFIKILEESIKEIEQAEQ